MVFSYPKIFALGHHMISDLFNGDVFVQEKIDGSQFSFMIDSNGDLHFRSKNVIVFPETAGKLFNGVVACITAMKDKLPRNFIFRGEAICRPCHNTLTYDRVPENYIVIFDIQNAQTQQFLSPFDVARMCLDFGLEYVGFINRHVGSVDDVKELMEKPSMLGGIREGLVFKNYNRVNKNGEILIGKFVSESFKETNKVKFRSDNPAKGDVIYNLIQMYNNENRWKKSIQHMNEDGKLENSPRDIGPLLKSIQEDIKSEEKEKIKDILFAAFWGDIKRGAVSGFPEWYKDQLLRKQFEEN